MRQQVERLAFVPAVFLSLLALNGSPPLLAQSPLGGDAASHPAAMGHIRPAGTIDPEWAWVVDVKPTQSVVSNLGPLLQGNSFHSSNVVNHLGVGWYRVTMTGVGATQGNVLVSAIAVTAHSCLADTWSQVGSAPSNEQIDVRCYDEHGSPVDEKFVVNWLSASDIGGRLGYGEDVHPTSCNTAAANAFDTFSGTPTVCLYQSPGQRDADEITFPHLGSAGGTVQITAMTHNALNESTITPAICTLRAFQSLQPTHTDFNEIEDTICQDFGGNQTNYIYRWHNAWFMDGLGLEGATESGINGSVAYLWANQPTAASYTPNAARRFSSLGGAITVTRQGVGQYVAHLGKMPAGGSAQVTAYGSQIRHCTIASISQVTPQRIGVRCFSATGAPTDTRFTLAYTR